MHGVRQPGPSEVLASAPGGSDSMVSETLLPPPRRGMLGRKSQLGVHDEQPATDNAPTRAPTRTRRVIVATFPRPFPPAADTLRTLRVRLRTLRARRAARNHSCGKKAAAGRRD